MRLIGGTVAVLGSDDQPGLAVTELTGRPLQVSHEDGVLTVSYESLTWEGLLGLLKPRKDNAIVTITVPAECPIQLGVLSASAVVTGLHAGAAVKSMSGDITLDGVTGLVSAETMSGEVAACDLDGEIHFKSVSGGLTLAGGSVDTLTVDTMSGQVTADVALGNRGNGRSGGSVHVNTHVRRGDAAAARRQRRAGPPALHLRPRADGIRNTADHQGSCLTYRKR